MIQTSRGECAHLPLNATQECIPVGREGSSPRLEALIGEEMTSSLWISGMRVAKRGDCRAQASLFDQGSIPSLGATLSCWSRELTLLRHCFLICGLRLIIELSLVI